MNKIIVPMDFSSASINALKYALSMFGKESNITIIHATSGMVNINDNITPDLLENTISGLKRRLSSAIIDMLGTQKLPNNFKIEVLFGNPVLSITDYVKDDGGYNAMVLATRDKYDLFDKWMGTVSLGLVKKLDIPIYLVPVHSSFDGFEKVLVASDYELKNTKAIVNIAQWNKTYNSMIKFLHIYTGESHSYEEERREVLKDLFDDDDARFNYEIDIVKGKDVTETLLGQAYNYKADLLIAIPEHHSFLHTLLFKSISKDLILKSNIPVLFIPNDCLVFEQQAHQKEWLPTRRPPNLENKNTGFDFNNHRTSSNWTRSNH